MSKYNPNDDGKVIDGKIVVFLRPAGSAAAGPVSEKEAAQAKAELAKAAAASMTAAAADGVPLCEDCEQTRAELQRQLAEAG